MVRAGSTEYGAMQVTPKALPPLVSWLAGWRFHASAWSDSVFPSSVFLDFKSLDEPGAFSLASADDPWSFHLGLKRDTGPVRARMLADGFQLITESGATAICLAQADGSMVGTVPEGAQPVLFSTENEVQQVGQAWFIDTGTQRIALALRHLPGSTRFALIVSADSPEDALSAVAQALDASPEELLESEFQRRSAFWEECDAPDSLRPGLARSVETLVGHLKPPEGALPCRWSCATPRHPGIFCISQLLELVGAWQTLDPAIAEELVLSAMACQQADGSLPSLFQPATGAISDEPSLPVAAQAALLVWEARRNPSFLKHILPALEQYLSWSLAHFRDAATGLHRWTSEREALIPEVYDPALTTADLSALLLCELDAYFALAAHLESPLAVPRQAELRVERERIAANMEDILWDAGAGSFCDRYANGSRVERASLSAMMPLIWGDLNARFKERLIAQLNDPTQFREPGGWRLWIMWEGDDEPPPFSAVHHSLLLPALQRNAPRETFQECALAIARKLLCGPGETSSLGDTTHHPESRSSPVRMASLAMLAVEAVEEHTGPVPASESVRRMDRHRVLIVSVCVGFVGLFVTIVGAVMTHRSQREAEADALVVLAHQHYSQKNYPAAIAIYENILSTYRDRNMVELKMANAFYHEQDYANAEKHYRNIVQTSSNAPKALMNLGLTLYQQGRKQEAARCYEEVVRRFAEFYPATAQRAETALGIIRRETAVGPSAAP